MSISTIAIIIAVITVILFASEKLPLSVVAILSMLAMAFTGCITFTEAFSGFSNTATLMIIGTGIIGEAFFTTGLSEKMGNAFLSMKNVNEKNFIILAVLMSFVLSTFLNALIVMALFMPIIDVIAAQSKGEFTRKNTYLPIGIAAVFGGNLSVVGSTSMLNASGMLEESYYGKAMSFFEPAKLGLPGVIICLAIFLIFGTKLQKKFFDFEDQTPNEPAAAIVSGTESTSVPAWKRWFVLAVMFLCIVGFVVGLNYGAVALLGGCAVIAAGCINMKQAIRGISWEAVLVVAGTLGFAKGVEYSGAGQKITDAMLAAFGPLGESPVAMCIAMLLIATILSNFMSNNATVGICVPIALSLAQTFGVDPVPFVLCCAIGANLSVATPICTATITMTTAAGYRFKDYARFGGLFNVLAFIATALVAYFIYF